MNTALKPRAVYIRTFPRPDFGLKNRLWNRLNPFYDAQDGFFRASLHAAFTVHEVGLEEAARAPMKLYEADYIFVNWKALPSGQIISAGDVKFLKGIERPKALVCTNARPEDMPGDDLADIFGVIFKREMYKDSDRYHLSFHNKQKLRTTMLSCPLIRAARWSDTAAFDAGAYGYANPSEKFTHDVFFAGAATSQHRVDIAEALHKKEGLNCLISLQSRVQASVEGTAFEGPRFNKRAYMKHTRESKISLALEGIGPFTYRHLELLCLNTFFLSTPKIKELELPIDLQDGVHYVSYESADDLADKALYYKDQDEKRSKIAQAGHEVFVRDYNFAKHGREIRRNIAKS
ncbi:MAG: glycosyltransferase [Alphaproteobacteria bacterium]|nr:glycosyltransferase [Alphaproteobacteria bacterium]MCD8571098.1 glycosyltransferase [Alphaproteobacteria bacterium]